MGKRAKPAAIRLRAAACGWEGQGPNLASQQQPQPQPQPPRRRLRAPWAVDEPVARPGSAWPPAVARRQHVQSRQTHNEALGSRWSDDHGHSESDLGPPPAYPRIDRVPRGAMVTCCPGCRASEHVRGNATQLSHRCSAARAHPQTRWAPRYEPRSPSACSALWAPLCMCVLTGTHLVAGNAELCQTTVTFPHRIHRVWRRTAHRASQRRAGTSIESAQYALPSTYPPVRCPLHERRAQQGARSRSARRNVQHLRARTLWRRLSCRLPVRARRMHTPTSCMHACVRGCQHSDALSAVGRGQRGRDVGVGAALGPFASARSPV